MMSYADLNRVTVRLTSTPAEIPAASNLSFYSADMNEETIDATYFWASTIVKRIMKGKRSLT